jgi:hypothetical protein
MEEITTFLQAKYPDLNAEAVITTAIQNIRQAADYDETYERGKTRLRYEMLYQQSQQIQDIQTALKTTIAETNWLVKAKTEETNNETEQMVRETLEPLTKTSGLPIQELLRRITLIILEK